MDWSNGGSESLDEGLDRLVGVVAGHSDPAAVVRSALRDVGDDISDDMALLALRRES